MAAQSPPPGFHTVTPALIVRGASEAIDFYRRVFGAEEVSRMPAPDGTLMHAEIRIGDSMIMLGDENPQWGTLSPLSTNGVSGSLHVYVDDADAVYQLALREGAKVRYPIENTFWGDRYGKVTDPFGHEWGIATHVRDVPPDEMQRGAEQFLAQAGTSSSDAHA